MGYKYSDNTLIHSIGFNFARLESILKYGILSSKKAKEKNISLARNYSGYNLDDTISAVRYIYINPTDYTSSYCKYTTSGIGFILEDVPYIYDVSTRVINHSDEVLVEDNVDVSKIKAMLVPIEYRNTSLKDLNYLPLDSTSYVNVKKNCDILIDYLKDYNYEVDIDEYKSYLVELYLTNEAISKIEDKSGEDYCELENNFRELVFELNEFFKTEIFICFAKFFNNNNVTLMDLVNYINDKYYHLPIYDIPFYVRKGKIEK